MRHVINILMTTINLEQGYEHTELYPFAFKTIGEADYELYKEGFAESYNLYEWEWEEENIKKIAKLKYTSIG